LAKNDIRPSRPGSSGAQHLTAYPITTGQTFEAGEVVVVAAAGTLSEAGDDPATVAGIAAGSSQGKTAAGVDGSVPDGTMIPVYTATDEQVFETRNFATDGAGTAVVPTLAVVGDQAGFTFTGGVWSVDTGTANLHVEIIEVLDEQGSPLGNQNSRTTNAGSRVRFVFL
jgi:hypothetical protein